MINLNDLCLDNKENSRGKNLENILLNSTVYVSEIQGSIKTFSFISRVLLILIHVGHEPHKIFVQKNIFSGNRQ